MECTDVLGELIVSSLFDDVVHSAVHMATA